MRAGGADGALAPIRLPPWFYAALVLKSIGEQELSVEGRVHRGV